MNNDLFRLVVDLIAFLALSDDETIDPDSALEQLEHAADVLKGLPAAEKIEFVDPVLAFAVRGVCIGKAFASQLDFRGCSVDAIVGVHS